MGRRKIYTISMNLLLIGCLTMKDWYSIGKNIRKCRKAMQIGQDKLAEKIHVSTNYIGNLERGEKMPSLETLVALADALGVSADVILHDVLENGYDVKVSLLHEQLQKLSSKDRECIYAVVETMIQQYTMQ